MKKSERIQAIVEIKSQQEKQSLELVGECQRRTQDAQRQLEHLLQYRREYWEKFQGYSGASMSVKSLLDFRGFIEKLDQAIAGQTQIVQQLELELQQKRKAWENLHQHTQSLQKVCDGLAAEELKIENKREQLESDDRSSRMVKGCATGMRSA